MYHSIICAIVGHWEATFARFSGTKWENQKLVSWIGCCHPMTITPPLFSFFAPFMIVSDTADQSPPCGKWCNTIIDVTAENSSFLNESRFGKTTCWVLQLVIFAAAIFWSQISSILCDPSTNTADFNPAFKSTSGNVPVPHPRSRMDVSSYESGENWRNTPSNTSTPTGSRVAS